MKYLWFFIGWLVCLLIDYPFKFVAVYVTAMAVLYFKIPTVFGVLVGVSLILVVCYFALKRKFEDHCG